MNDISQKLNNEENNQLNNSIFEKEGEYIINKKPKYKYEIKIVHENLKNIELKSPKTPDKIQSPINFSIISDKKRINFNEQKRIAINKNKFKYKIFHANTPDRDSTIRFFSKDLEKRNQLDKKSYYLKNYNYYNINKNSINKCICQREFNRFIKQHYIKNINKDVYKYHNFVERNNEYNNNINKREIIYIKKPNKQQNFNNYNYNYDYIHKINNSYNIINENIENNNYDYNKSKIIKISNSKSNINNNLLYKENSSSKKRKRIKRYKNKRIRSIEENNNTNINNTSFLSIDNSRPKNITLYKSPIIERKENENISLLYNLQKHNRSSYLSNILYSPCSNSRRSNQNSMINKSSETKQKIKIVPIGQKIKPLIIKKKVEKPKIEKIINKDGSIIDVIKQDSVITAIEAKPVLNSENEKVVKENITKIYTTLTKNVDDINDKNTIINDINDNLEENKIINDKNEKKNINQNKENNYFYIRRDFKNKNDNNYNLEIIDNSKKKYIKGKNNLKKTKKYKNKNSIHTNNDNYNYVENKQIIKNEQIKKIKYLYYNNSNELSNYFLNLNEEDKINILTSFNDGNLENKNIYTKLINIIKEKNDNEEENAIIINNNSFEDNNEIINTKKEPNNII